MHCPNCNRTNAMKNAFCVHCGEELSERPVEEAPKAELREARYYQGPGHQDGNVPSVIDGLKERFESSDELSHGQAVIVAGRWILVGAGLLLALWNPDAMGELQVQIMLILGLAVGNFFLHSQLLMRKPVIASIAYGASAADIAVISLIVIAAGGFDSGTYVFYFPALLALSVAFRTEVTYTFAGAAIVLYGLIASATMGWADGEGAVLLTRMLMIAAVAVCGNIYWRTERDRRQAAAETRDELIKEIRSEVAAR